MVLYDLEPHILQAAKDLLSNDDNWAKGEVINTCKVCETSISDDDHFRLLKDVDGEQWCISFHYGCAIVESWEDTLRYTDTDGWIDICCEYW